jgi:L-cystine transport system substrate-binding protein
MKKSKIIGTLSVLAVLLVGVLSGCSSNQSSNTTKQVKTIYVGTQNDYPPFCYKDDKGQLTGYDVEVVKAINKKLDGYKFVFQDSSWDSIFPSLETNKIQIVADEIARNPEREQKYLFSDVPYFDAQSVIIAKKGRTNIKSLKDLEGLTVAASPGDSYTQLLEKYNSENGNKIKLKYIDADVPTILQDIQVGRVDAYVNDPVMTKAIIKKYNLDVQIVGKPVQDDKIYLTFNQSKLGQELKANIDPIIKELKADGTLEKLSKKWTGGEYIPK